MSQCQSQVLAWSPDMTNDTGLANWYKWWRLSTGRGCHWPLSSSDNLFVGRLITIGASRAQTLCISGIFGLHLLLLKTVHEQLCWQFSGHTCRHVPGRCLGCAVFANICKDRPGTICNSQWPQATGAGAEQATLHRAPCWWHWDLIVSRSPGYQSSCLYFPALPRIITGSGSVTCCVRPGLSWWMYEN